MSKKIKGSLASAAILGILACMVAIQWEGPAANDDDSVSDDDSAGDDDSAASGLDRLPMLPKEK